MSGTRDENVFMAQLAQEAERWDDMAHYMKGVAVMGSELTDAERNMLHVAVKNSASLRRQARRQILGCEMQLPQDAAAIANYRKKVDAELQSICKDILALLDSHLIGSASSVEAKVFYIKMKGDYCRYGSEFAEAGERASIVAQGNSAYTDAWQEVQALNPADSLRLGVALNFAVFRNEVLGDAVAAVSLAQATIQEAKASLDVLGPQQQDDAMQILALLQDNLKLWSAGGVAGQEIDGTEVEDF
mmetsp:Transcript_35398/g.101798  ORF Transcript_35398/g.101798 Transcript_35398/m.101798 type:complete len:245 (+) Transcript_35398:73-807(+)